MVNKDGHLLTEAYLSALQKYHHLPSRFVTKQPDDTTPAETLEDRMQGITSAPDQNSTSSDNIDSNNNDECTCGDECTCSDELPEQPPYNDNISVVVVTNTPETQNSCSCTSDEDCCCIKNTLSHKACESTKANLYAIYKGCKQLHDLIGAGYIPDYWMNERLSVCSEHISNILKVAEYDVASKTQLE